MIPISRYLLIISSSLYALYHAALGVIWLSEYPRPELVILALLIYLATVIPTIVAFDTLTLPPFMSILNLSAAGLIPVLINSQIDSSLAGTYATWYVAAVGTLMAATAIRQKRLVSWLGLGITVVQVIAWGGIGSITTTGVVGATALVFAGQAISTGLSRTAREAQEFADRATKEASEMASTSAIRQQRKARSAQTLRRALPILQRISDAAGQLTDEDRQEARLLESELRDEIRGRNLITDRTRESIRKARLRGLEVTVLDEGGLDSVDEIERVRLLNLAADAIDQCQSGRVTLRSPSNDEYLVTMVCMRPGAAAPDIWLRLPERKPEASVKRIEN
ncbi:MAG: hypothetical protein RL167_832 [Actinomycetota bacterium]